MTALAGTPARVAPKEPALAARAPDAALPAKALPQAGPTPGLPIVDVGPAPTTLVVETTPLAATPRPPRTTAGAPTPTAPTAAPPLLEPTGPSPQAAEQARAAADAERQAAAQASQEAKVLRPVPGQEQARRPAEGSAPIVVELAVHSPSNFYKGLSGNDVVDHGGVFVATYKIPKRGTAVALRVVLPGELEFDAEATVQWTREIRSGDEQPGFGAQFTRISAEGRGLVARYARKREPMFYDDL
jgi:hypothetical protein